MQNPNAATTSEVQIYINDLDITNGLTIQRDLHGT